MIGALAVAAAAVCALVPSAAAARRPNVLVIVTDDQRAHGTMQVLPTVRKLFHRGGVRFPNAVANTPNCCPSRATIMTGRYPHNHGVWHNNDNQSELAQLDQSALVSRRLRSAGYRTGLVGRFLNGWNLHVPPPGFQRYAMTLGNYRNTTWSIDGVLRTVRQYATRFAARAARGFIASAEARDRKPWFLYVAPSAPHGTFGTDGVRLEPEGRYAHARVGPLTDNPARSEDTVAELLDKPPFWRALASSYTPGPGAPDAAAARAGQLRLLMSVDDLVRGVFAKLRRTRERRRTLAIFLSDNGLFWGEHGAPPIKDMPYLDAVQVPLAMRWPGRLRRGRVDRRTAAAIDITPTILEAANMLPGSGVDGRSLLRSWDRPYALLEYRGVGMLQDWASLHVPGVQQYTEYFHPGGNLSFREHYDLRADPWQLSNSLGNPNPADDPPVAQLSATLAAARACGGPSCP